MSEVFLPYAEPRRDDPFAALVVQENVKALSEMFTRGSATGDVPTWDQELGKFLTAPGVAVPTIGTSFPTSPVDKQEAIVMDSLTAPTYAWRFVYIASITDSYKWVAIGPKPLLVTVATEENIGSSGSWNNLATTGPTFTVPWSGIWLADGFANGVNLAGSPQGAFIGFSVGGGTPARDCPFTVPTGGRQIAAIADELTITVGNAATMKYKTAATASFDFGNRSMRISPARVSG